MVFARLVHGGTLPCTCLLRLDKHLCGEFRFRCGIDDIQFRYALGQAAVMDIVVIGYRFLYIDDRAEDIRFVILSVVYRFYRPVDHYDIRRSRYKRFPFLDRIGPRTFATGRICQVWHGVGFGQNAR